MLEEVYQKTGCPVTNIISTHCGGMWRLETEMVDQKYHTFNAGYGKVSHSGYHFLDIVYRFVKASWTPDKRPHRVEVVSSFAMPNGFQKCFSYDDYKRALGPDYPGACRYSDAELKELLKTYGEIDAALQISFIREDEPITLAQVNLQHNGFTRRSWVKPGPDLYKGIGRVKHEFHEIKSGPFQTVVIDSRQANDKHDRSKPSTATIGTDNHFEVHVFRNSDIMGEEKPLTSYSVADLDRSQNVQLPGIYSENVKHGILWEAVGFLEGQKELDELTSSLEDHSVPAHLMSATYISHWRRIAGLNPVVNIDLKYSADISPNRGYATASIRPSLDFVPSSTPSSTRNVKQQSRHLHKNESGRVESVPGSRAAPNDIKDLPPDTTNGVNGKTDAPANGNSVGNVNGNGVANFNGNGVANANGNGAAYANGDSVANGSNDHGEENIVHHLENSSEKPDVVEAKQEGEAGSNTLEKTSTALYLKGNGSAYHAEGHADQGGARFNGTQEALEGNQVALADPITSKKTPVSSYIYGNNNGNTNDSTNGGTNDSVNGNINGNGNGWARPEKGDGHNNGNGSAYPPTEIVNQDAEERYER